MPFRRIAALPPLIAPDVLTSQLVGIGMNFAAPPAHDPNIEDSVLFASIEGMEKQDLRVLAMLVTWFGIHAPMGQRGPAYHSGDGTVIGSGSGVLVCLGRLAEKRPSVRPSQRLVQGAAAGCARSRD